MGQPSLKFDGVPTFLDVEAMPDRGFYYLIGLGLERDGQRVEHSFWADGESDERLIWETCLNALKEIGNPQIVSYGAYETRFLKQMKGRYVSEPDNLEFVNRLIENAVNLVDCMYGKIYFPTYSNSLKEIGRYLGFEWTWPRASGAAAPLLRRAWELGTDDGLKRELIGYNIDDCRASAAVADALVRLCAGGGSSLDAVDVGSLDVSFEQTWDKFDSASPAFAKINAAAYWDYQRDRVYIRSNPHLRSASKVRKRHSYRSPPINKTVQPPSEKCCPDCNSLDISINGRRRRLCYDMRFSEGGFRRWVVKHIVEYYRCRNCYSLFSSQTRRSRRYRYSDNVLAYSIYNIFELNISQYKLAKIMNNLFGYPLSQPHISRMIQRAVDMYGETYELTKQRLLRGHLIHADETHISIKGKRSYVWVFTNMEDVLYIYSENRAGDVVANFLESFDGVLVSDFYGAYESLACPQQKCLVHLMRDLNDNIHKEPFNLEVRDLVREFGALLEPIIDTIDRFGLKTYFLKKHKKAVTRFYNALASRSYNTESAKTIQRRFKKHRENLFIFLDHDNIPWNNNNAEHAIKSFAKLRDVIGGRTTTRGIRDYLLLLSIYQTCVYREIDFLSFLRSGKKDIKDSVHSGKL